MHLATIEQRTAAATDFIPHIDLSERQRHTLMLKYENLKKKGYNPDTEKFVITCDQEVERIPPRAEECYASEVA
jgi:hypothetical protein